MGTSFHRPALWRKATSNQFMITTSTTSLIRRFTRFTLSAMLFTVAGVAVAQGPPGRDPYNPPPGHGGVPPGQAKKYGYDDDHMPPGQAKKYYDDGMPP